jgi:mRNA interferase MazF
MYLEQGDIIEISFEPSRGHEPQKTRPALVVSSNLFNESTSMPVVCPITTTDNGFFLHRPLPAGHKVYGFVVLEQLRTVDAEARKATVIDHLTRSEMRNYIETLTSFFGEAW